MDIKFLTAQPLIRSESPVTPGSQTDSNKENFLQENPLHTSLDHHPLKTSK